MATMTAGLLACAVAFGCSKKEQARNDPAVNAGTTAAAPADTTLRTSQGGTVAGSTTTPGSTATTPGYTATTPNNSAGVAHNPAPSDRADASMERRQGTTPAPTAGYADRSTTSSGGTVATARTSRSATTSGQTRTTVSARTTSPTGERTAEVARVETSRTERNNAEPRPAEDATARADNNARPSANARTTTEGAPLNDNSAAPSANNTTITAEPQVVNVVLLANIGDSERATRMCLNPAAAGNQQIREYVQAEIRDHSQLNARLNQMVRAKNIIPTRSSVGDQFFTRNQDQPRADENARDFFARESRLHQDMLTAIDQQLLPIARDTALRQLLTDGRQTIQAHLTRAQQLQGTAATPATSMNAPTTNATPSNAMQPTAPAQSNAQLAQPAAPLSATGDNRASAAVNQPGTMPTYGQPQPIGQRTPATQPSTQPTTGAATPNPSSQRDTANRDNKPANLTPAYGETTSVTMRPPTASVTTTPSSATASVTTPSASVTTTPGAAAAAPVTNPCDAAPASYQSPGAQLQFQNNMQRDPMQPARPDSVRVQLQTTPRDTSRTPTDTTRARPTPPRP